MLRELDSVILQVDVPEYGLRAGDVGIVVSEPLTNHRAREYEVEFTALSGEVIAVIALREVEIRQAQRGEIAHVRNRAH